MTRTTLPHRLLRIAGTAGVIALVAGLLVSQAPNAQAAIPLPDGLSESTAAASCWEVKQNYPSSTSGIYWIVTPELGAPEQFYCDQATDGGGWVLVGRGREDWSTSNEGFGTPAQVRDVVTGPAAFAPRQLSSEVIDALLNGQGVNSLAEGIRLHRATTIDGSTWQDATFRFSSPRTDWTWMFDNAQRVSNWRVGSVSGTGGTTNSFGSGTTTNRVQTATGSSQGWVYGFGLGTGSRGNPSATSYLWAPSTTAGNPRPFTQVFLRPKLMSNTVFPAIPDAGTTPVIESAVAESFAKTTVWGVNGLGAGPSSMEGSNEVSAFTESNGVVYVGGNFLYVQRTSGGGSRVQQSYLAAFNVNTGEWISSFRPTLNNQVKSLATLPDGRIAVGGFFTQVNGAPIAGLAVLNPTTGATDTVFTGRLLNYLSGGVPSVRALDVHNGWLYAGGSFTHATGGSESREVYARSGARFSTTNGTPDGTWNPTLNGTVMSLDASDQGDRVYFAGHFTAVKDVQADKGAAVTTDTADALDWTLVFSNRQGGRSGYQQAVEEVGGLIWLGGSEHSLFGYDRGNFDLIESNITVSGGDFQAIDDKNGILYAGCHCFHTNFSDTSTWSNPGTGWTRASKINSIGAWDAATGDFLPAFSPMLSSRNGAGAWAIFVDSTDTVWTGGDYTHSYRAGFVKQWSGGFARFASGDAQPPTVPSGVSASLSGSDVVLNWGPSTDNRGTVEYEILRNNRVVATTSGVSLTMPSVDPAARYFVRAADPSGNRSASSPVVVASDEPQTPAEQVLIEMSSGNWSYWYQTDAPASAWKTTGYDASAWQTGAAPLGWGHSSIATQLNAAAPKPVTSYFRKTFTVDDASQVASLTINTRADDGIVLYLNGTEVGRVNIDSGAVTHSTYANAAVSGTVAATNPVTFEVSGALVTTGTNVLTAEVHSNYRSTPSASFDVSLTARSGEQPATDPDPEPEPDPEPDPEPEPDGAIVPAGSQWAYRFEAEAPNASWNQSAFDSTGWATGAGPLGWGTSPTIVTPLTTAATPKPSSVYFRSSFELAAGSIPATGIRLTTYADDGIIVFVNGVEVGRSNLISGTITHNTYANSAPNTTAALASPVSFDVAPALLVAGTNTIAVQVVSNYRSSPSLSFDLSASAI